MIDGRPPTVIISTRVGVARCRRQVSDVTHIRALKRGGESLFGDGSTGHGRTRLRHRLPYASGVYTIVAHVRNKLGFRATVRRLVSVK